MDLDDRSVYDERPPPSMTDGDIENQVFLGNYMQSAMDASKEQRYTMLAFEEFE
jgi:hypothetical protein